MEEEISLWEIVETILKGKWIIFTVTAVAIIIAVAFTFFPKTSSDFRADASVRLENIPQMGNHLQPSNYLNLFVSTLLDPKDYNADVFAEVIKHPDFLYHISEKLNHNERGISQEYLHTGLDITLDASHTILTISITHSDPELAIYIVNTVLEELRSYVSERNRERVFFLANNFERLITLELRSLETLQSRLAEIRSGFEPLIIYNDSSHLTPEYVRLSDDIAKAQSQIAELEVQQEEIINFGASYTSMFHSIDEWAIFSPATEAVEIASEPKLLLNITIAAILGIAISIMAVIFLSFWKEFAPKQRSD